MQKETRRNSAAGSAKPNPPRKLTRAEKKQIAEIIRQAKKIYQYQQKKSIKVAILKSMFMN